LRFTVDAPVNADSLNEEAARWGGLFIYRRGGCCGGFTGEFSPGGIA